VAGSPSISMCISTCILPLVGGLKGASEGMCQFHSDWVGEATVCAGRIASAASQDAMDLVLSHIAAEVEDEVSNVLLIPHKCLAISIVKSHRLYLVDALLSWPERV